MLQGLPGLAKHRHVPLHRLSGDQVLTGVQQLVQVEGVLRKDHLAAFHFAHVQHVVHQRHQVYGSVSPFFPVLRQPGSIAGALVGHFDEAQDTVDGSADVVAHPGQEVGFCRIGQLGFLQCLSQCLIGFLQGLPGSFLLPGLPGNVPADDGGKNMAVLPVLHHQHRHPDIPVQPAIIVIEIHVPLPHGIAFQQSPDGDGIQRILPGLDGIQHLPEPSYQLIEVHGGLQTHHLYGIFPVFHYEFPLQHTGRQVHTEGIFAVVLQGVPVLPPLLAIKLVGTLVPVHVHEKAVKHTAALFVHAPLAAVQDPFPGAVPAPYPIPSGIGVPPGKLPVHISADTLPVLRQNISPGSTATGSQEFRHAVIALVFRHGLGHIKEGIAFPVGNDHIAAVDAAPDRIHLHIHPGVVLGQLPVVRENIFLPFQFPAAGIVDGLAHKKHMGDSLPGLPRRQEAHPHPVSVAVQVVLKDKRLALQPVRQSRRIQKLAHLLPVLLRNHLFQIPVNNLADAARPGGGIPGQIRQPQLHIGICLQVQIIAKLIGRTQGPDHRVGKSLRLFCLRQSRPLALNFQLLGPLGINIPDIPHGAGMLR